MRIAGSHSRATLAPALLALATVAAAVALVTLYAERVLFDSDRFADRAQIAIQEPAVKAKASEKVSDALLDASPDLIAVEPLVRSAAEAAIGSRAFGAVLRAAAFQAHASVFDQERDSFALTSANVSLLALQALRARSPELAAEVPDGVETTLLSVSEGPAGAAFTDLSQLAQDARTAAWVSLALALVAFAGAVAAAPDRRLLVRRAGLGLAAVGAVAATALVLGRALVAQNAADAEGRDALRAVWDAFLADLFTWCLVLAAGGLVVAAAAESLIRPVGVEARARALATSLTRTPARRGARALRALALVAAGLMLVAAPDAALRLALFAGGALLVAAGAEEVLRLAERPRSSLAGGARPGRRRARLAGVAVPGVVALGVIGGLASLAAAGDDGGDAPRAVTACNGDERLCDRRLGEVTLAATHNSMSAPREGFLFPNQQRPILAQLEAGIRGLLIDTHLGVDTPKGVYTLLAEGGKSREKVEQALGPDAVRTAERLRAQIGYRGGGDPEVYLCHGFCEIGASRAVDELREVRDFLVSRPGEVLVMSIEDQVTPEQTAEVFEESGLIEFVWKGPVRPLPTLREMVDNGGRVLVMGEEETAGVDWYHPQFDLVQETPFDVPTAARLVSEKSCRRNRGEPGNPMLLLNHFVQQTPPLASDARKVNARDALADHARECARALDATPSLLAVDLYEAGDAVGAAALLNGEAR